MSQTLLFKALAGLVTVGGTISVIALTKVLRKAMEEAQLDDVLKDTSQTVTASMLEIMYLGAAALLYLASKK